MEQMFFCLVLRVIGFCLCKPLILNVIETFAESEGLNIPSLPRASWQTKGPCSARPLNCFPSALRPQAVDGTFGIGYPFRCRGRPGKPKAIAPQGRLIVSRQPYDRKRSTAGRSGLDIPALPRASWQTKGHCSARPLNCFPSALRPQAVDGFLKTIKATLYVSPFALRKVRDSNPRNPEGFNRFRVCPVRPLRQLSAAKIQLFSPCSAKEPKIFLKLHSRNTTTFSPVKF